MQALVWRSFGISLLISLGSLGACAGSADEETGSDTAALSATYGKITGLAGKCLDASGGGTAAGTKLILFRCNGGANQQWLGQASNVPGPIKIASGRCLGVASTANATQAQLFDCNGSANQTWTWHASTREILGPGGKCLDVYGGSSADRTPVTLYDCHGGANQQWIVASTASPPTKNFGFANGQGPNTIDTMSNADITRLFTAVKATGGNLTRIAVDSVKDTQFANQFRLATAAGMKVLPCVMGTASTGASAYAAIARDVATTYAAQGVTEIELGNEWNNAGAWQGPPDPVKATQYTVAAYDAIKAVAPQIKVVSAGLSPYGSYGESSAAGTNPITFLEQEYAAGVQGHFDALGWHPYNFGQNYTAAQMLDVTTMPWSAWAQMSWTTPNARSVMAAHGDGAKTIVATESGAPTNGSGYAGGVSEAVQAQWVTQAIAQWKTFSWAGDLLIYTNNDHGTSSTDREDHFGVIRTDWSAKPALAAFKAAVN